MPPGVPLDFLRIWHRVFAQNLEYVIARLQDASDFRPESVGDDTICKMGCWLAEQSDAVRRLPEFVDLCAEHARFHRVAASMIQAFQDGNQDAAQRMVQGEYAEVVRLVDLAIDRLSNALGHRGVNACRFNEADLVQRESIWNDSLNIGIPHVDRRHHAMAMMIDQLNQHPDLDVAQEDAQTFLGNLRELIRRDARGEQEFLSELQDNGHDCVAHLASHEDVLAYFDSILDGVHAGVTLGSIGQRLGDWYIEHLVTFDIDLAMLKHHRRIADRH